VTEYETIKFEQSGLITRITLNRPDAANGMNDTMTRELADAARRCDTDEKAGTSLARAILLRRRRLKPFATARVAPSHQGRRRRPNRHRPRRGWTPCSSSPDRRGGRFSLAVTRDLVLAAESASFTMAHPRGTEPRRQLVVHLPRLMASPRRRN
jgi:2-(1,2-epoxy-1,2-dihydrophenyl)acetyl-CoA isomerase